MLPPAQPRTHKLFRPMISLIPYLLIRLSLRFYSILFKSGGICNIHTKKHEWNGVNRLYKDPPVGKLADQKKTKDPPVGKLADKKKNKDPPVGWVNPVFSPTLTSSSLVKEQQFYSRFQAQPATMLQQVMPSRTQVRVLFWATGYSLCEYARGCGFW